MNIARRAAYINKKLAVWVERLNDLRAICHHPDKTFEYHASVGHYDPQADHYWIKYRCPDCGKTWTSPQ